MNNNIRYLAYASKGIQPEERCNFIHHNSTFLIQLEMKSSRK
jgi:hypothetical protein